MLRQQRFVDAARDAFLRDGYAATTMSSIAGRVGGSKTTLWTCFSSKEKLFAAVVDDIVAECGGTLAIELPPDEEPGPLLTRFGLVLLSTLSRNPVLALYRLVVGEASHFPDLARMFHDRVPARGKRRLAEWMQAKMERGEFRSGDPMLAARQFVALCQAGSFQYSLLGLDDRPGNPESEIAEAVAAFLAAWMSGGPLEGCRPMEH